MKAYWIIIAFLVVAAISYAPAREDDTAAGVTVITSVRLTFDYDKQYALFEDNVVVTDPEMKLTADKMNVYFDDENQVKLIVAEGAVQIEQADKIATSGKATYKVATGTIVLEDEPRVRRGKDLLEGTIITFWRDENKMVCEPQARLVIFPDKGGTREQLFGE